MLCVTITNSVLNSPCFAWHPYGKLELFKTELVILLLLSVWLSSHLYVKHRSGFFATWNQWITFDTYFFPLFLPPMRHGPNFDHEKSEKVWDLRYHIRSKTNHCSRFCFGRLILANNSRGFSKHCLYLHCHIHVGLLWPDMGFYKSVTDQTGRWFQVTIFLP